MAARIEDAGFEIRDMIAWIYGSGFPKSLNISTAVEKLGPKHNSLLPDEQRFCGWMRESSGLDEITVKRLTGSSRFITGKVEIVNTSTVKNPRWGRRAMVPTAAAWEKLVAAMRKTPPKWVSALIKNPPAPLVTHPGQWKSGRGEGTAGQNEWQGWGTALKPALEPITVARKPLIGTVAANVLEYGTGGINVDGCRVESNGDKLGGGRVSTDTEGWDRPWKHDPNAVAACRERGEAAVAKAESQGRWPANLIHDGSDEINFVFSGGASDSSTLPDLNRQVSVGGRSSSPARFFYCAKASKKDRDDGCEGMEERVICITEGHGRGGINTSKGDGTGVRENRPRRNHHPTVKPTALMRYLCRLVTPRGGTVLDPFMGSGSTGKAAVLEGFNFIGIEREAEYMKIAKVRIDAAFVQQDLFAA
jgi:hypothetical protein